MPIAKEIRAEKFVVVDENGKPRGAFGFGKDGNEWPDIEAADAKGRNRSVKCEAWGGKPKVIPQQ
jgi:hypothetical protein